MRFGGQYVANAPPMIHLRGMGPQKRLSSESPRLSPIMNQWPAGTVTSLGKSQPLPLHCRAYGSFTRLPLRITWPRTIRIRSPGPPTIRLMNVVSATVGVSLMQIWPSGGCAAHCPPAGDSAPAGGWNTSTSPTDGSPKRLPSRLTSTRWPMSSVGSREADGIRYGLTRNAWMNSARPIATATIITSSTNEPRPESDVVDFAQAPPPPPPRRLPS